MLNPKNWTQINLRDENPELMDEYLTEGGDQFQSWSY